MQSITIVLNLFNCTVCLQSTIANYHPGTDMNFSSPLSEPSASYSSLSQSELPQEVGEPKINLSRPT